jgi:hypothetical protein
VKRAALALLFAVSSAASAAPGAETSITLLPNAAIRFRGEGKVIPQSYTGHFGGETSPLYRIDWRQPVSAGGYWGFSLIHTGVFGGGRYAGESVQDLTTGGVYQTNRLNVGFTNVQATYRRPLADHPAVEALVELTVAREIFKRSTFVVQGVPATLLNGVGDDVDETSAEGIGVGLAGRHARGRGRFYGRWETVASHLVQIFDARTDASAGQIFRAEAAAGARLGKGFSIEAGALWYYWFLFSQGDRRLSVPGTPGAAISWNRKETRASGFFIALRRRV